MDHVQKLGVCDFAGFQQKWDSMPTKKLYLGMKIVTFALYA
jgi:hypothetical protein